VPWCTSRRFSGRWFGLNRVGQHTRSRCSSVRSGWKVFIGEACEFDDPGRGTLPALKASILRAGARQEEQHAAAHALAMRHLLNSHFNGSVVEHACRAPAPHCFFLLFAPWGQFSFFAPASGWPLNAPASGRPGFEAGFFGVTQRRHAAAFDLP